MARGGYLTDLKATLEQRPNPAELPASIEAEQALLGILIGDASAWAMIPENLAPRHFAEPFHGRLFNRMKGMVTKGDLVDPIVVGGAMASDPAFVDLGGIAYLGKLVMDAPPTPNLAGWAKTVIDTGVRRELIETAFDVASRALDADESTDGILADLEKTAGELHVAGTHVALVEHDDAVDRVLDAVDNPGNHPVGISTGLEPLDRLIAPLLPGDLIGLGGRPGMGKSAVAAIITRNVASIQDEDGRYRHGVIEIHGEMSVDQVTRRRLTATAFELYQRDTPAYSQIRKRTVEFAQRQMLDKARDQLRGIPLKAIKRTGLTLGRLRAICLHQRALWARQGIRLTLVSIDHAGLLATEKEHRSRVDQQTEISGGLKVLAGDLEIPVMALLQLSRQVEGRDDKRPQISDFRDSGSWEQDLDFAIGAYRPAYYAQREKEPSQKTIKEQADWADWDSRRRDPHIEIIGLKAREGEVASAKLWADMRTNAILGAAPPDFF